MPIPDAYASSELRRIDRTSIKDQALEQLKRYIVSGAVQVGQRLPSERELAVSLGVGRNSVREALKVLEAIGLVETRVGEGTFIVEQVGASLGRTIGLGLAVWGGVLVEVLGARLMIEPEIARHAALRADADDLLSLRQQIARMESHDQTPLGYLAADMMFHRQVAIATHNPVVAGIVANLVAHLEVVLSEAHSEDLPVVAEGNAGATHRDILAAIEARDECAAHEAMTQHIRFSTDVWTAISSLGSVATDVR